MSAFDDIIGRQLKRWGLGAMSKDIGDIWRANGGIDGTGVEEATAAIYTHPTFIARFPDYQKLIDMGRPMSPLAMMQYENDVAETLTRFGIDPKLWDNTDFWAEMRTNDISPVEVAERASLAAFAVTTASRELKNQLGLYGIGEGEMTSFWLDPDKTLPKLQQKFGRASVKATGEEAGLELTKRQAAKIQGLLGVTGVEAYGVGRQQMAELATQQDAGLFSLQAGESQTDSRISEQTQIDATFAGDAGAQARIERRRRSRAAQFGGGGSLEH